MNTCWCSDVAENLVKDRTSQSQQQTGACVQSPSPRDQWLCILPGLLASQLEGRKQAKEEAQTIHSLDDQLGVRYVVLHMFGPVGRWCPRGVEMGLPSGGWFNLQQDF